MRSRKMKVYCEKYDELGQGGLLTEAEEELSIAEACVTQLKAYSVDMDKFESFIRQCSSGLVHIHVRHCREVREVTGRDAGSYVWGG